MDDDDDFGDLYTDILRPVAPPPSGPLTAGDRTPLGNPNSQTLIEDPDNEWLPDNWNDDAAASAGVPPAGAVAFPEEEEVVQQARTPEPEGFRVPEFGIDSVDLDQDPVIPGPSSAPVPLASIEPKAPNSEDWDSDDSEDDLQIVLNDSSHHNHHQMMVMGEDEEGQEEDLAVEEQDWGEGELMLPSAASEGERKEGTEAAAAAAVKANGAVGTLTGGVAARVGYGTHTFHPQHHSIYKYVRPGAAPGPPVLGAVGPPGQIRPPTLLVPNAGRGRGDWRPPGIRGSFHYGYPVPAWGSSSGRGFGGGLDFTLPSHKTVFEVDLESFEEKPWRHPEVDISDYFNFGLNEDTWKDYSKQLDQLRLESTMQSKIRVHEFVRPEQDYDPDLPPELAAATGHHDISADNLHYGKIENGQVDLSGQGRGAPMRPLLPQGRPIQVETGFGERLPSIDTRPPRTRDADAIIEIVLHDSMDDSAIYDGALDQAEKDIQGKQLKGIHDVEGDRRGESEYSDHFPPSINGRKRERVNRRMPFAPEGDGILPFPPALPLHYHPNARLWTPLNPSESVGTHHGGRLGQGASRGRCSSTSGDNSHDDIGNRNAQVKKHDIHQKQRPGDSMEGKQTPEVSPDIPVETSRELSTEQKDGFHDDTVALGDSVDVGGEETSDVHISGKIVGGDRIDHSSTKQKLSSRVEQPVTQDNGDHEDLRGTHSDNSKAKSGSSKEYQKQRDNGEEVVQDRHLKRARDLRRHQEDEHVTRGKEDFGRDGRHDIDRNRMSSKGRGPMHNSYPYRHWDSNSAHPVRGRSEGFERPREPDILFRQRREDDINRRVKDEDLRRERIDETGLRNRSKVQVSDRNDKDDDIHTKKGVDDRDWRGCHRGGGPRQREKDDALVSRRENFDEFPAKRKKDEDHLRRERVDREDSLHVYKAREDSSHQKRERDDIADNRREETSRIRGKSDDHHTSKHRDESWRHREREDSQRLRLPHVESLVHREREEGRGATRRRQPIEDKPLGGSGRSKNDSKGIVSDKDYLHRDKRRHAEQSKKGDHTGEENNLLRKGCDDVLAREKHYNREERSSRHERLSTHNDRSTSASDNNHMSRERLRDGTRKSKDIEGSGQTSQGLSKREHEDHSIQQNEKVKSRDTSEQDSNIPSVSKKGNQLAHSSVGHGEDIASDDENQQESRKGRSKLERWTSHKERDFSATSMQPSLSSTAEEVEGTDIDIVPTDELGKIEGNDASDPDAKGADEGEITDKLGDDRDRHLDTVAKLKKRSERFKLPMPGEKDMVVSKKPEHESQLAQTEGVVGAEVKPERPARKRRWASS